MEQGKQYCVLRLLRLQVEVLTHNCNLRPKQRKEILRIPNSTPDAMLYSSKKVKGLGFIEVTCEAWRILRIDFVGRISSVVIAFYYSVAMEFV